MEKVFSDELLKIVKGQTSHPSIQRLLDEDMKELRTLKEIPESKIRLYSFRCAFSNSYFFDNEYDLVQYVKTNDISFGNICVLEYLESYAGRSDVIRQIDENGGSKFYAVRDEEGYSSLNIDRSIRNGEYIWEYNHGSLRDIYCAFRDRGIEFKHDIYADVDDYYQKIFQNRRGNSYFHKKKF